VVFETKGSDAGGWGGSAGGGERGFAAGGEEDGEVGEGIGEELAAATLRAQQMREGKPTGSQDAFRHRIQGNRHCV
jgi:hypothetical protein